MFQLFWLRKLRRKILAECEVTVIWIVESSSGAAKVALRGECIVSINSKQKLRCWFFFISLSFPSLFFSHFGNCSAKCKYVFFFPGEWKKMMMRNFVTVFLLFLHLFLSTFCRQCEFYVSSARAHTHTQPQTQCRRWLFSSALYMALFHRLYI